MKVLILGLGSIARKHILALREIDPSVSITAMRSGPCEESEGIRNIYSWEELGDKPDFIIISNPTSCHKDAIIRAAQTGCPLFIEKPSVLSITEANEVIGNSQIQDLLTYVACNLRFHPSIAYLREHIQNDSLQVQEVNVYCGSDLSAWRPGQDYSQSYSAKAALGGGVHLDLIHEIDYCYWLFGRPDRSSSLKRKVSALKTDSIDFAAYHLEYENFTVNIILNYYRKKPKRYIEIVSAEKILYADIYQAAIMDDEARIELSATYKIQDTYLHQMRYFIDCIRKGRQPMNSFMESCEVLKIATGE